MKKILVLLASAIAVLGVQSANAQSLTSYFMEGATYRTDLNPALVPTRGYITLPGAAGVGLNWTTNFLCVDNYLYAKDGKTVSFLHESVTADEFMKKLPELGKITADVKTRIFGLGFYVGKSFWSVGIDTNVSANMAMSMDLFRAIKTLGGGNYDLGTTSFDATAYMNAYLGASIYLHKNVSIGIKAKFLAGAANLHADFSKLGVSVSDESVKAEMRGAWRANGVILDGNKVGKNGGLNIADIVNITPDYILNNLNSFGFAFDVGTEVRLLNNHLKISAAVTDLGLIKWSPRGHVKGTASYDFAFEGINFEEPEMKGEAPEFTVEGSQNVGYETKLNFSVNAGIELNALKNHIAVGVLSHTKFCHSFTYSELIASLNLRPMNWLSLSVTHTILNMNKPSVFGVALNFHPRAINIFVGADFVDTSYVNGPKIMNFQLPLARFQDSVNLYAGVSFNFKRPKYIREAKKLARQERKNNRK